MATSWKLSLLGRWQLDSLSLNNAGPVPPFQRGNKARALLAYLALHPQSHCRETLTELLWPEGDPGRTRHCLRTELHMLRSVLGKEILQADRHTVRLKVDAIALDVTDFENAANAANLAADLSQVLEHGIRAVDLYAASGPLLPGFYDDWAQMERERLEGLYHQTLQHLVKTLENAADIPRALLYARLLSTIDPDDQSYRDTVFRLHAALSYPSSSLVRSGPSRTPPLLSCRKLHETKRPYHHAALPGSDSQPPFTALEGLSPEQKQFLHALAVFPGSFTTEAAAAVTRCTDASTLIKSLCACSLLTLEATESGPRWRMMVEWELAAERKEPPEENLSLRHLLWCVKRATDIAVIGRQTERYTQLASESENFAAALAWALCSQCHDAGIALLHALYCGWYRKGE